MPLHKTEAFVLRTYALKEADKICVFFTKDHGKLRGVAHGARKLRSRFGSALEPFTELSPQDRAGTEYTASLKQVDSGKPRC